MIYWLIPYLVAYNASDAGTWRYGPEHVFKAEVRSIATTDNLSKMHSNVDIYMVCRPMNSSEIQCRVESATIDNWSIEADGTSSPESHSPEPFEIGDVAFQFGFYEGGLWKLWEMDSKGTSRLDMFFSIFSTVHWGIFLSEKKFGRYVQPEKSMIGACQTTFDIRKTSSKEETNVEKAIDGYHFDVPAFKERTNNEPIVIEKTRNVTQCAPENMLYLFGNTADEAFDKKHGLRNNVEVKSSRSRIYLGTNSFSGYTRITGTLEFLSSRAKTMRSFMNVDESIRLSLETIRPAKEAIRPTKDLAKAGTGTPQRNWPIRKTQADEFFM